MTKERVAKHTLERIALAELQNRRGCEDIVAIKIEYVPCGVDGNWRICMVNFGDATTIQHPREAVALVSRKLMQQYNLLTDAWCCTDTSFTPPRGGVKLLT
jgi:hypothetical protein